MADTKQHFAKSAEFDFAKAQLEVDPVRSFGTLRSIAPQGNMITCFFGGCIASYNFLTTFEHGHAILTVHVKGRGNAVEASGLDIRRLN